MFYNRVLCDFNYFILFFWECIFLYRVYVCLVSCMDVYLDVSTLMLLGYGQLLVLDESLIVLLVLS